MRVLPIVMFLIFTWWCDARTVIQLKDCLCGCEHCVTVPTQEPLDIGRHMIMCHSWRDATLKTMRIMEEMRQAEIKQPEPIVEVPQVIEQSSKRTDPETGITYDWQHNDQLGMVYADVEHVQFDVDQWLYLEHIEWVWMMGGQTNFLFSYDHGWLYTQNYFGYKIYYWYDRRTWCLSRYIHK